MRRPVDSAAMRLLVGAAIALTPALVSAPSAQAQAPVAPANVDTNPDPWQLGDALSARLDGRWNAARGVYMNETGFPDTRLNSLMLQLHAMAARAGHEGASRQDNRIAPLARVFLQPPVLVTRSLKPRVTGHFPHAPAWTPGIGDDPELASLHPSIDTSVVRALVAAWRVRDAIKIDADVRQRIPEVLSELANSPFYRAPSRALNQINWHVEVYAAALEVANDTSVLDDYRAQLVWFADHADKPAYPGGSSNLTAGGGFRYLPNRPASAQFNRIETIEYGNLALSALGMYGAALKAGMEPLSRQDERTLRRWSKHMLLGSWTHSGYPNWDTGLGTKRRHLRQYWAWSLDGMMTASGPDALLGYPDQRAYVRSIAQHAIGLYLATAWDPVMAQPDGPLPIKTSFDAPNGFATGSGNHLIGPLRFAILDAALDRRFQEVPAEEPPSWYSHDRETGRFTVSTRRYNGAILPARAGQSQGGLEPVRLFDGAQRPLFALGGRGRGSLGISVLRKGRVVLDTEAAIPGRQRTSDVYLRTRRPNSASAFSKPLETVSSARSSSGRVSVRHRFSTGTIVTRYRFEKVKKGSLLAIRIPVWGNDSLLAIQRGAVRQDGVWRRTTTPLRVLGRTSAGAELTTTLLGVPKSASFAEGDIRPSSYHPDGGRQLTVTFRAPKSGKLDLTRKLYVSSAE